MVTQKEYSDRLCLFVDKLGCGARMAIRDGYTLSLDSWGITHAPLSNRYVWRLSNTVRVLPAGDRRKKVHPLTYILLNRLTTTADRFTDIDRIMGLPPGAISHGFNKSFRSEALSKQTAESLDYQCGTSIYTVSYNLGLYCMNVMYAYTYTPHLDKDLTDAVDKALKGIRL